jgi:uncharacterized protein YcsI (UPF0317 family)
MNPAQALRLAIRRGHHSGLTTGHSAGFVQANLVVLPQTHARDFLEFCRLNAAACPVLGVSAAGSPNIPALGFDLDVRTDLPGYLLHQAGQPSREVSDISSHWRSDSVAIAIGCWFSMEGALAQAGIRMRHIELGIQGSLFKTNRACHSAGIFSGPLVVSMRPFAAASVQAVSQVTSTFTRVHGGPAHVGDAAELGIAELGQPDFGEVLLPQPGEVPMYWACGLTATVALQSSGIDFFITHAPGKMLVTDRLNTELTESATP